MEIAAGAGEEGEPAGKKENSVILDKDRERQLDRGGLWKLTLGSRWS